MVIRIEQGPALADRKVLEQTENLIIFLPAGDLDRGWTRVPWGDVLKRRAMRSGLEGLETMPLVTDLPNRSGTRVSLATLGEEVSSFALLGLARRQVAAHLAHQARALTVIAPGFSAAQTRRIHEAVATAVLAGAAPMPEFRRKKSPPARLSRLRLGGVKDRIDVARVRAEADGNNLARELTTLPPNELTPGLYRRRIAALARAEGWRMSFLDSRALKRKGAGAFLAVAQGSATADAGIVHLQYRPKSRKTGVRPKGSDPKAARSAALALVGKGICFDTGGVNLKPAKHMHGMHEDMAGSAVALGTLLALSRLKAPFEIDCWLALAQNHIGPRAYKQNDVVKACNGVTIEVMHTDAEGRMVLADTLALASRAKPGLIIDYATLTGSCVYALSTRYSGAFTNRPALHPAIIAAGADSGERVWPFPIDADFDQDLDSKVADIKQCTLEGAADHILAARFLTRFVDDRPWLHIDLSAGNHKGGLAHIPTDITGFGVRFTLNLLLDRGVLHDTNRLS
jgi:leucyl aminopeptidase